MNGYQQTKPFFLTSSIVAVTPNNILMGRLQLIRGLLDVLVGTVEGPTNNNSAII
jgi:hypothetical protein